MIKKKSDIDITLKIPLSLFKKYEINSAWFLKQSKVHDILHEYRVLIHSYLIAKGEGADIDILCNAARFHDLRREDDGIDLDHGKRCSEWLKEMNVSDKIREIVKLHNIPDRDISDINLELKCFKDADGLDRCRIDDLDIRYLRTETGKALVDFAKILYEKTKNITSVNEITEALRDLDILDESN